MFWTSVQVQEGILKLKPKLGNDYHPNSHESREEENPSGRDNKPSIQYQGDYLMVGRDLRIIQEMFTNVLDRRVFGVVWLPQ